MIASKLAAKARTTVPRPVRAALKLKPGDEIAYAIEKGRVVLTKAAGRAADDPFARFDEWSTDADERAYAKL